MSRKEKKSILQKPMSRRDFNTRALGASLTVGLSGLFSGSLLTGCGDGNEGHTRGDKTKDLHFDLSHLDQSHDYAIRVAGTEYALTKHTPQTVTEHRQINPSLTNISEDRFTHFITDIALPANAVRLIEIRELPDTSGGAHGVVGVFIHHPGQKISPRLRATGLSKLAATDTTNPTSEDSFDADHIDSPNEAAKAIIFHHPELLKVDSDLALKIWAHIEYLDEVNDLATSIHQQGRATTTGGWATLEPAENADGSTATDADGNTLYHYVLSDQTKRDAAPALKKAIRNVKADDSLKGTAWEVNEGVTSIDQSPAPAAAKSSWAYKGNSPAGIKLSLKNASSQYGIKTTISDFDETASTLTLVSKNNYLRHASLYFQLLDSDGNSIDLLDYRSLTELLLDNLDENKYYIGLIAPELTAFGIPVYGPETESTITIPAGVPFSSVKILYGSLGISGYSGEALLGILATAVLEYIIPGWTLVSGIGDLNKDLDKKEKEKTIKDSVIAILKGLNNANAIKTDIEESLHGDDTKAALVKLAKKLYSIIPKETKKDLEMLFLEQMVETRLEFAVPFVGWAMEVASIVGTAAELAETTIECLCSPFVFADEITFNRDIAVTIDHAEHDIAFPATAANYKVSLYLDEALTDHYIERDLPAGGSSGPITENFTGIPTGGKIKAVVAFYSADGTKVAHGDTGDVDNNLNTPLPEITVKNDLVPLTSSTTYAHQAKLGYEGGGYTWQATDVAPTATLNALSHGTIGGHLGALEGITYHQDTGAIGYAWQAAGGNISELDTGIAYTQLHLIQGVSALPENPEGGLQTISGGFRNPAAIVYDLMRSQKVGFYIDSRDLSKNHLRGIDLAEAGAITPDDGLSYGYFTQTLDALIVYKNIAVGANWLNSKLEILRLPSSPTPDENAVPASPLSGKGIREGLLHGPIALAVSPKGTLLVLETVNNRVQALDLYGNPDQKAFKGQTTCFMPLREQSAPVTYLDLSVEYRGYLYVHYYLNNGTNPADYYVDIYTPDGKYLTRTRGVAAAKLTVDLWRTMYTLNYEKIAGHFSVEPSISKWIPST